MQKEKITKNNELQQLYKNLSTDWQVYRVGCQGSHFSAIFTLAEKKKN